MEDLTPIGLSKDGRCLILVDGRGEEYAVPYDHRLRTALKGETGRFGQLEMTMESTLRPRDIQNRIRAGESAEEVAAAAGTTADRIMGFAGPVLAERAHVAESAQASSVRRASGESSGTRVLSESALVHLRAVGAKFEDVAWDAWRREDGRWLVVADYVAAHTPHHAEFVYDVRGRYVVAENDEARRLTGELQDSAAPARAESPRRLSAVPAAQDELPLGDDAIELVREDDRPATRPVAASTSAPTSAQAPSESADRSDELTADHADADWIAAEEVRQESERANAGTGTGHDDSAPAPEREAADAADDEDREPTVEVAKPAKRKGRSSVPSWDEIMFGGGPTE